MTIETDIPPLNALFDDWRALIGEDFPGYRNHVYRMLNFCMRMHHCSEQDRQKLVIAGVFHDLALWTDKTLDYPEPSAALAMEYLKKQGLEDWQEEITLMITEHHKLRSAADARYPLVEVFRQADLVDFSLGTFKCGLPADYVREVRTRIPNAGFHAGLVRKAGKWFVRHPFNPAPMMKW